ncbi:MAG: hypothetical protein AAGJ83_10180 [Planctomycetota bacterium]
MAKKKSGGISKSQAIRDYMNANPSVKPKGVAEALKAKGYDVTPNYVSMIKFQSKNKSTKTKRRGRTAGTTRKPAAAKKATSASDSVSLDSLIKVKEVVRAIGSIEEAKSALEALEKLSD